MPTVTEAYAPSNRASLRPVYGELHRYGLKIRELATELQELSRTGVFGESGDGFRYDPQDPTHILNRSIDITRNYQFLVAVTGAFSSGKSTLLNLLLGQKDLLPSSAIPMTAVCTVVRYGATPSLEVRYAPLSDASARIEATLGRSLKRPVACLEDASDAAANPEAFVDGTDAQESLRRFGALLTRYDSLANAKPTFDERAPLIAGGGTLKTQSNAPPRYFRPTPHEKQEFSAGGGRDEDWVSREWLALIRDVTLRVPSPLLKDDIVLLDLPGLNCQEDYHRRAVQEYCHMADCVLVTAFQPGNQADRDVIANFKRLSANYREKVFFVLNKVDQFQGQPEELIRSVDYLTRDTIGEDFPPERFFLTSAHISSTAGNGDAVDERRRFRQTLREALSSRTSLDRHVTPMLEDGDEGGILHLERRLRGFLTHDAYRTKLSEIVLNYDTVLNSLRDGAGPRFDELLGIDGEELLRQSALDYVKDVERLRHTSLQRFRYEYLSSQGSGSLRGHLKGVLEKTHSKIHKTLRGYFDRPILETPLYEDPVGPFDLLMIADRASRDIQKQMRDLVIANVYGRVRSEFDRVFLRCDLRNHLEAVLGPVPGAVEELDALLERYRERLKHSVKCLVRTGFVEMPRGRCLKRLDRPVSRSDMKGLLVEVFEAFYADWVYEHVYGRVLDGLGLSLFLDCEDLEEELDTFFRRREGAMTSQQAALRMNVPSPWSSGSQDLLRAANLCRDLEELQAHGREITHQAALGHQAEFAGDYRR